MGCGDACPYIPGKRYIDWNFPDPKGRPLEEVRATRDDIPAASQTLAANWTQRPSGSRAQTAPAHFPVRAEQASPRAFDL